MVQFPKLRSSGGYELLRTYDRGKLLSEIDIPPSGYSVSYLKAVVHNANIFVGPLQNDLSTEPEKDEVSVILKQYFVNRGIIVNFSLNSLVLSKKNACFAREKLI